MKTDRKTYRIMGTYEGKSERVDTARGAFTARYLVREYQMAFGRDWVVWAEDRDGNRLGDHDES